MAIDSQFVLRREIAAVHALTAKYADIPMDLADGCIVRMAELARDCKVWTVDRADFSIYRRYGRDAIPCEFPPFDD